MRATSKSISFVAVLALFAPALVAAHGQDSKASIDGRWDASLVNHGTVIPFRLDISGSGPSLKGTFYNGFQPYDGTTSATYNEGKLVLNIEHYLTTITATLQDGQLVGEVSSQSRASTSNYTFQASRHVESKVSAKDVPSIAGSWIIPLDAPSSKGEKAFRFIVEQHGAEVAASILRVDGDTGAYSGTYKDGKWVLSHFDGSRPGVIQVSLKSDGTLEVLQNNGRPRNAAPDAPTAGSNAAAYQPASAPAGDKQYAEPVDSRYASTLIAYRSDIAIAKGLPQPENYDTHTTVRDPNQKFTFDFPDVNGKLVSNDDPRFKGKVVLAIVTGTWCPNCHDEAQYLVQLDKKYRDKGLAIVALDFEEPEQQGSLEREKAFVKQYGVKYTYLIAGAPSEMWEKVPELVNLNTWPATVFIGRDGLVKGVHSGFASPASGKFNQQLKDEFTARIEQLLAERPTNQLAEESSAPDVGQQ
ncbi:TlpA disulfide reductase family protein [Granulicella sp. 5B5]|uniref:TlpA family protein disulfide reductase n=1 Tax=Granulicella sp. 5B5 TaxID=1617967 RepID=UPI0015F63B02|nr:TlpA disulfide reductase family protein [Granulicella sp. 5B5]